MYARCTFHDGFRSFAQTVAGLLAHGRTASADTSCSHTLRWAATRLESRCLQSHLCIFKRDILLQHGESAHFANQALARRKRPFFPLAQDCS